MTYLVTGGGGFLGRYIVEQLLETGGQVRSISRNLYPELQQLGVTCFTGDLNDPQALRTACEGVETVFHVAAVPGVWGPWNRYYQTNTLGTSHLLSAARQAGVRRFIYTSSPSVVFDGQPHLNADESLPYPSRYLCHYPRTKALAEQQVLAANDQNFSTVSLRPHLIWGPRDNHLIPRLLARARAGRLRRVGDGTNVVSMAYVENVAAAHLQVAAQLCPDSPAAGKAYFINEPEPVNLWQWVDEILSMAGLSPVRQRISARLAWLAGATLEGLYTLLGRTDEPLMTRFVALQLSQSHSYSIKRAQQDFGYHPLVSVAEGMRRMAASWQRD